MTNKDKVYLVTGSTRGIGAAIARRLLEDGASVIIHYNSSIGIRDALIKEFGETRVLAIKANLENDSEVDGLWKSAIDWKGHLDGIVNNAAIISSVEPEADLAEWRQEWRRTMQVNSQAMADLCRYAILAFKKAGGGTIVNVSSRAAFRGDLTNSMHYAASKGAVLALTRSIAKGYAKDNIQAYIIAPGWVATERVMPTLKKPGNEFMIAEIPTGEPAPPEELGNIVAFLLSGQAKHATGATFDINGASYFH
ncbi:MAG: SDR family NAD(P)-dependent oxidoreductase [Alphaproteobacteria bacterium]